MSLADELLADLDDVDGNDDELQGNVNDLQQNNANGEDSDVDMVNGEEDVSGLVLEG